MTAALYAAIGRHDRFPTLPDHLAVLSSHVHLVEGVQRDGNEEQNAEEDREDLIVYQTKPLVAPAGRVIRAGGRIPRPLAAVPARHSVRAALTRARVGRCMQFVVVKFGSQT